MFLAIPAGEDVEYSTPVESKQSTNIGLPAVSCMAIMAAVIVGVDFFWFLHQASASIKVKPVQPQKHKRPRVRQQYGSWQNDSKISDPQVGYRRDITASDLAYRRDLEALKYKLSIINF